MLFVHQFLGNNMTKHMNDKHEEMGDKLEDFISDFKYSCSSGHDLLTT